MVVDATVLNENGQCSERKNLSVLHPKRQFPTSPTFLTSVLQLVTPQPAPASYSKHSLLPSLSSSYIYLPQLVTFHALVTGLP